MWRWVLTELIGVLQPKSALFGKHECDRELWLRVGESMGLEKELQSIVIDRSRHAVARELTNTEHG